MKSKIYNKQFAKVSFLLLFFVIFLTSCMQEVKIGELEGVSVEKNSDDELGIVLFMRIDNPNLFKVKIKKIDMKITLNTWHLGKVESEKTIVIPANSNDIQEIPVKVEISNLLTGGAALISILTSDKVDILLYGDIEVRALFKSKTFKIDEDKEVELF